MKTASDRVGQSHVVMVTNVIGHLVIAAVSIMVLASAPAAAQCTVPLAFEPIPELRAHVGFPVDYRAVLVPGAFCGGILFGVVSGPPEFSLDGAGGLFYWTPATTGTKTITVRAERLSTGQVATVTFQAIVDDNTMSYPLFRDYLSQATTVPITGRAHGAGFVSYTLEYADQATPSIRLPIAGPITTPVTNGLLGELGDRHARRRRALRPHLDSKTMRAARPRC